MTTPEPADLLITHTGDTPLDPLGDIEALRKEGVKHNRAKVGSARPSSLLYTYGPGSIMDLPHFTVMASGFDDWERIWERRDGTPTIHAPALLDSVRVLLRHRVGELRPFPHQASASRFAPEGADLGVPARVFPQWLRCTGCDLLGPLPLFRYTNNHPFRTDKAVFEHADCYGRKGEKKARRTAVTARYLLTCVNGHLDEFPYDWWVHEGGRCPKADIPTLKMPDAGGGRGASAVVRCESCGASRGMNQAQGATGREKLPRCRGRHPHLGGFTPGDCTAQPRLMLVGASNLWFPSLASAVVMPRLDPAQQHADLVDAVRSAFAARPDDAPEDFVGAPKFFRKFLRDVVDVRDLADDDLESLLAEVMAPPLQPTTEERQEAFEKWDPLALLAPEWNYLQRDPAADGHKDEASGLALSRRPVDSAMPQGISRVLAVDALRKVNALIGFTRVDAMDRTNDLDARLVPLSTDGKPDWVVATEDRGEGIFLQLDEARVSTWERGVLNSDTWMAHRESFKRNWENRFSETGLEFSFSRMPAPRYWLIHTLSHLLIREMAMSSGYGAASISERLYAWEQTDDKPPAAGVLVCTTASDSDGTLGGLVRLSRPDLLADIVTSALRGATRCSSDPVCAGRTPSDPEDFLHGAACHCCTMASETSCERANRFLDRRFLVPLPGAERGLAFFDAPHHG